MKESSTKKSRGRAASPEEQQSRCEAMALNIAEQRLADGTASSQMVCHFLKQSSLREKKEIEKLEYEKELLAAKKQSFEDMKQTKALYEDAIKAMRVYSGSL